MELPTNRYESSYKLFCFQTSYENICKRQAKLIELISSLRNIYFY